MQEKFSRKDDKNGKPNKSKINGTRKDAGGFTPRNPKARLSQMYRAVSVKGKQRLEYLSAASGRYYQVKRRNFIRMGKRGKIRCREKNRITERFWLT